MAYLKKILLFVLVVLVVGGAASYFYIQQQFKAAEVDKNALLEEYFTSPAVTPDFVRSEREPCKDRNPNKNAYWGDTHVHTSISYDSSAYGNIATPADAYRFAKGEPLTLNLRFDSSNPRPTLKLDRPLDFLAVTDHAEGMGEITRCFDAESSGYGSLLCKLLRGDIKLPVDETMEPTMRLMSFAQFKTDRSAAVCGKDGSRCLSDVADVWKRHQRYAEEAYDRSSDCTFTSFPAYEYSLARDASNLHRNIIFANGSVPPVPLSAKEVQTPEELWQWLDKQCVQTDTDCDVLTIPHNSNWSNGQMYYPYSKFDISPEKQKQFAQLRASMEPLVEIMQIKGDSECRNGLGMVLGGEDQQCNFEKLRHPEEKVVDCGDGFGGGGMLLSGCVSPYSYVRYALIQGLAEEKAFSVNPHKYGIIAATDIHNGAAGYTKESEFEGSMGMDTEPHIRVRGMVEAPGGVAKANPAAFNPGGIAGVWAEENTRESLFNAMRKRETFGTSGPRITPRFFASWDLPSDICEGDIAALGYEHGVPMGSDLPRTANGRSPQFVVSAMADQIAGATPLQKVQIIKGWADADGKMQQRVYDVAGDAEPQGSVDTQTCKIEGIGHKTLCGVWQDPEFDESQAAVYYARVIENPSCRWSAYDCNALPQDELTDACTDGLLPKAIQERAWTSPVWYTPN